MNKPFFCRLVIFDRNTTSLTRLGYKIPEKYKNYLLLCVSKVSKFKSNAIKVNSTLRKKGKEKKPPFPVIMTRPQHEG